ncbi:MAG: PEGA domain-containing protein [Kofleriaceae bacterium]
MTDHDLDRTIGPALASRRPTPAHDFDRRLRLAVERPAPVRWLLPVGLAAAVVALAVVVLVIGADRSEPTPIATRTIERVAPAAPVPPTQPPPALDLLPAYQAVLDAPDPRLQLDAGQRTKLRDLADGLAKQRVIEQAERELAMIELRRELEGHADPKKSTALLARVTDADAKLRAVELAARMGARDLLTTAQRAVVDRGVVATVATARGRIRITSDPLGVATTIDGRLVGRTPLELELVPGKHEIRLALPGYKTRVTDTDLAAGEQVAMTVVLEKMTSQQPPPKYQPPTGTLRITAFPATIIYVDGKRAGDTPLVVKLAPGKHTVMSVAGASSRRTTKNVTIESGKTMTVTFEEDLLDPY